MELTSYVYYCVLEPSAHNISLEMILKQVQICTSVLNCVYMLVVILFIFTLKSDSLFNYDSPFNYSPFN